MTDCFLCSPPKDLVVHQKDIGVSISGLGPLSDAYLVVGTLEHTPSLADLSTPEIKEHSHQIEYADTGTLKPYANNAKKHPQKQVAQMSL